MVEIGLGLCVLLFPTISGICGGIMIGDIVVHFINSPGQMICLICRIVGGCIFGVLGILINLTMLPFTLPAGLITSILL
jgi:hypothetical protein